jgi:site-specific DNA-methyltransferase (adenine-specific)
MKLSDKITITNEDCMELLKRTPDKFYDLAIVDPPYGIKEAAGKNASRNKSFGKENLKSKKIIFSKDYGYNDWDNEPASVDYFIEIKRVSKNQIIWGANHFIERIPNANSSSWIVWDKDNGQSDFADAELAWTSFSKAVRMYKFRWNGLLQQDMKNKEHRIHPTQKPIALYKWLLHNYAKPNDKILDTHIGSMSIAIACADYGFELVGCELDKEYYQAGIKRVQFHVAQKKLPFL